MNSSLLPVTLAPRNSILSSGFYRHVTHKHKIILVVYWQFWVKRYFKHSRWKKTFLKAGYETPKWKMPSLYLSKLEGWNQENCIQSCFKKSLINLPIQLNSFFKTYKLTTSVLHSVAVSSFPYGESQYTRLALNKFICSTHPVYVRSQTQIEGEETLKE